MKNDPENFFCTMCWRPRSAVKKQSKLCYLHATSDDSKEYKRRRRRLEKLAIEKKLGVKVDKIVWKLCTAIKSPDTLSKMLAVNTDQLNWNVIFKELLRLSGTHYKNTVSVLNSIGFARDKELGENAIAIRHTSPLMCAQSLIRYFDKESPNVSCNDYLKLSENISAAEQHRILLHLLARLEVEFKFKLIEPTKRGPKSVSKHFNAPLYTDLLQAISENKEHGITIRISEIARHHGMTKQAVHEKLVWVIADEERYRKHISDFEKLEKHTALLL